MKKNEGQFIPKDLLEKYEWIGVGEPSYPLPKKEDDTLKEWKNLVDLHHEIDYHSIKEPTGEKEIVETGNSERPNYFQNVLSSTGYVRPHFRFLNKRFFSIKEFSDDYVKALKEKNNDEIEIINQYTRYRDSLLKQIQRQSSKVKEINDRIAEILFVYLLETRKPVIEKKDIKAETKAKIAEISDEIFFAFRDGILEGARFEELKNYWLSESIRSNPFIDKTIKNHCIRATENFGKEREPYLYVAELLAQKIDYCENVIEVFMCEQNYSNTYLNKRLLPDPQKVASTLRNPEYDQYYISLAMMHIRSYIADNKIRNAVGNVSDIVCYLIQKDITKPHKNTLRTWVKKYCEFAEIPVSRSEDS